MEGSRNRGKLINEKGVLSADLFVGVFNSDRYRYLAIAILVLPSASRISYYFASVSVIKRF